MCDFCEKEIAVSENNVMKAKLVQFDDEYFLYTALGNGNYMRIFKTNFCPLCGRDLKE